MHFHPPARRGSTIDLQPETQALLASEFVDVSAALREISQKARVLTRATGVAIALAHKKSMICRASVGNAPSLGSRLDTTSGFSGECVRMGQALRCDDSESDGRVDLESCRRLGIRSILAIPIRVENQIVGLMEVFSPKPNFFNDWHASLLRRLLNSPLLSNAALTRTPDFLIELEPANKLVVGQPLDAFIHAKAPAINLPSLPAQFWSDVFVPSALPWRRFAQSLGLHIVFITALLSFVRLGLHGPHLVQPKFNSSDVLYYSSSEYFGRKKQKLIAPRLKTHRAALQDEPVISIPREHRRRTEESVAAPDITLKRDTRVLPATAWSSVSPSIPSSAITRNQFGSPAVPVSVVAPPPELSVAGSRPRVAGLGTAVIEPPPSVEAASRQFADLTIGALQVISPPPAISAGTPNSKALAMQAGLHDDLATVIAPSPSLDGIHLPSARGRGRVGGTQVVPPPPQLSGTGKWPRQTTLRDGLSSVIGPSPSLDGIAGSGAKARGRFAAGAAQVVPPPPQISGTGTARNWTQPGAEIAVVSPPPSVADLAGNTGGGVSTRRVASPNIVPLAPATESPTTEAASGAAAPDKPKWSPLPPMEPLEPQTSDDDPPANRKELNIAPIAPATALASSSYFGSSEIFIAEERLGVHRRRYIKLVYDYLPYQKRLSEYGPNYPQVAKLRARRDVTCDENLTAGAYSMSKVEVSQANGWQALSQAAPINQDTLPCFRTTADDYRRALAQHPKRLR